jgi:hypothetical protein
VGPIPVPERRERDGGVPCGYREARDAQRSAVGQRAAVPQLARDEQVHVDADEAWDTAYPQPAISSADVRQDRILLAQPQPGVPDEASAGDV